jgi:hypothetical protein
LSNRNGLFLNLKSVFLLSLFLNLNKLHRFLFLRFLWWMRRRYLQSTCLKLLVMNFFYNFHSMIYWLLTCFLSTFLSHMMLFSLDLVSFLPCLINKFLNWFKVHWLPWVCSLTPLFSFVFFFDFNFYLRSSSKSWWFQFIFFLLCSGKSQTLSDKLT